MPPSWSPAEAGDQLRAVVARRSGPRGAAVESDEPPAFLRLGNDALRAHRRLAAARLDTIQTWEHLPTSTDIDI
jgi:hypothetical protein